MDSFQKSNAHSLNNSAAPSERKMAEINRSCTRWLNAIKMLSKGETSFLRFVETTVSCSVELGLPSEPLATAIGIAKNAQCIRAKSLGNPVDFGEEQRYVDKLLLTPVEGHFRGASFEVALSRNVQRLAYISAQSGALGCPGALQDNSPQAKGKRDEAKSACEDNVVRELAKRYRALGLPCTYA